MIWILILIGGVAITIYAIWLFSDYFFDSMFDEEEYYSQFSKES